MIKAKWLMMDPDHCVVDIVMLNRPTYAIGDPLLNSNSSWNSLQ